MANPSNRARAVTFDEFARRGGNGGGGGRDPRDRDEPLLSGLWKRWAAGLVDEKIRLLEAATQLTPSEFVALQSLKADYERVSGDSRAACRLLEKQTFLFPLLKPLVMS